MKFLYHGYSSRINLRMLDLMAMDERVVNLII